MSRIIDTQSVGKQRTRLQKAIVISIRELMSQTKPTQVSKDLAAFIALALIEIAKGVERTVAPWEKRNYWVKADRFRMDWAWAEKLGEEMKTAAYAEDWQTVALISIKVGTKLNKIQVSPRHRMGKPWLGAWEELTSQVNNEAVKN